MTESPATNRAIVTCEQWLGSNAYAGMKALRRTGWVVEVVPEREFVPLRWRRPRMRALGRAARVASVREFNDEILRLAARVPMEFFLAFKGAFVMAATLRKLKDAGTRTYLFYPDVSFRAHGPWLPEALSQYDWIFTTKRFGLTDLNAQLGLTCASVLLHGYDSDLHRPVSLNEFDRERYGCDVSFIGTWSPKKEAVLAAVARARPSLRVRIWGEQWNRCATPELSNFIGGHEVVGEEYVRAITASTINLAILSERRAGASDGDQITSRTFHIPACGGFMLHERTEELGSLLAENEEVVCYGDVTELVQKIDLHLEDDSRRRAIAERGSRTVRAHHSWDARIRDILAHHARATA